MKLTDAQETMAAQAALRKAEEQRDEIYREHSRVCETLRKTRNQLDAAVEWARTQWEFLRDLGDHDPLLSQLIYQRTEAARRRYERLVNQ